MGPGPHPDRGNRTGDLLNQLRAQGVSPQDVDIVAHTHLHADHVGWNIDHSGAAPKPYFPNARYLVPRLDWEHFTQPRHLAVAPQVRDSVLPLEALGLMDLVDEGYRITDEITTLDTPGHTPGHQVILISSQGERAMIVGDAIHSSVQIRQPDWCAGRGHQQAGQPPQSPCAIAARRRRRLYRSGGTFSSGAAYRPGHSRAGAALLAGAVRATRLWKRRYATWK